MPAGAPAESSRRLSGVRYALLLAALLAPYLVMPLLEGSVLERPARAVIVGVILLAGLGVLWEHRRLRLPALVLLAPSLAAPWLGLALDNEAIRTVGQALAAWFLLLTTAVLAFDLARETRVTAHTIYAAICGYLMIGSVFAAGYVTIEFVAPGSFGASAAGGSAALSPGDFSYFSVMTLATVGYGDIIPLHKFARGLAAVEAVVGQFYIAGIVARLVTLFVASRRETQR